MGNPKLRAAFFIFLALSMTPIDASRTQTAKINMQSSLMSVSEARVQWSLGSTPEQRCERWRDDFETKTAEVQQAQAALSENASAMASARVVLKLRSMVRVYELASRNECEWIEDRDVDTEALMSMMNAEGGLSQNPCFAQAQAVLSEEFESEHQQVWAMSLATQMLVERRCSPEDLERMEAAMEQQTVGGQQPTQQQTSDLVEELDGMSELADREVDSFVDAVMEEGGSSLLQTVGTAQFVNTLQELVALVAFLIIWAVLCLVFIPVILMVVGAVLCTLAWVIRRFFPGIGSHGNLNTCIGWWAHQTQTIFAPGNELVTIGACLLAGFLGGPHVHGYHFYFPGYHIHHR